MTISQDLCRQAAIIGCGRIGSILEHDRLRRKPCTHAGLFAKHSLTELIAGCDIDASRRAAFSRDWGIPASMVFEDYREMLSKVKADIVSVATWTESHAEIVIEAARSGAKIILCEKPMAISIDEADRMVEVCDSLGVTLAIHHERRWELSYRSVKSFIEKGGLGEIRTIIGHVLTGTPKKDWHSIPQLSGGGPALHDGTHLFDVMRYLCGKVVEVKGETERHDSELKVEDTARAVMRFENGAVAYIECGGRRKYFDFELDIQGTLGRIIIGNAVMRYFGVGPSQRYENFTEFTERQFPMLDEPQYFPFIVDELMSAHRTGRRSISSGEDGRDALRAVLAIYGRV